MMTNDIQLSTGLPGLDRVLKGFIPGDNIVWQVSAVEDYLAFVKPFCISARKQEKRLVYFRFAKHQAILDDAFGADIHVIDPEEGFETFIAEIHQVIREKGRGAYYVFDCLTDLAADWFSDQMLGNFFMLTCPYLYDMEAIAYFALLRNHHAFYATSAIANTTQLFLDVYHHKEKLYVRPLKVQQRHSPMMFTLHAWIGDEFIPVTDSPTISEILTSSPWPGVESASPQLDVWNRTFRRAEHVAKKKRLGTVSNEELEHKFHRLLRMMVAREERVFTLAAKYFTLSDLLEVGRRMIGTGLIGGKSVGMLLARAIIKKKNQRLAEKLETHDSFFIGSDVFYTFLVHNGCWRIRQQPSDLEGILANAFITRQRILMGSFPDYIVKQFVDMLDYYGQSPILVRSSSLLEDNFGNSFPGKYESIFCANQGSRHKRLEDFISAVRTVYASTMSEKAITYRANRGILEQDEQMALLVMRVSGSLNGSLFYPHAAGVGYSFNPFVWEENIESEAGVLRLVFGLGTRAVDRSDDDYTRLIALSAPQKRPESSEGEAHKYSQKKVDVLDMESNQLVAKEFNTVAEQSAPLPIELCASSINSPFRSSGRGLAGNPSYSVLTFDKLLSKTAFASDMREILQTIHEAYEYPVDIEFTVNFTDYDDYKINLVQCRPFQVKGGGAIIEPPTPVEEKDLVLHVKGPVIGHSRLENIDRVIYVVPSVYGGLPLSERYSVARLIGQLTHPENGEIPNTILLIGPGRWGTTTPSLGVPVSFADINTVSIICEIVAMRDNLVPDVSLGTHFFSEMIELDMLYLAFFPDRKGNLLNEQFFSESINRLPELYPDESHWSHVVRVIDVSKHRKDSVLRINANTLKQRAVCYFEGE